MPRDAGLSAVTSRLPNHTLPLAGTSRPARMRRSVVLPDPEGPSSATNSPSSTVSETSPSAGYAEKLLETCSTRIDTSVLCGELTAMAPLERGLEREGDDGEEGEKRSNGEGGDKVVVIVESLNLERHGVGLAADVTGNDADCPKLPHRPRVAQQHAIEESKADIREGHAPECLPAGSAESQRRFLVGAALRDHQR